LRSAALLARVRAGVEVVIEDDERFSLREVTDSRGQYWVFNP
jgi:antitoxin (DNA-binding transcriptional repressor) of toxin-antitoxin stability system